MTIPRLFLLSLLSLALLPAATTAHHSFAIYSNERIEMEGDIVDIRWQNPHVIVELRTMGVNGEEIWHMEGGSPTNLQRTGVTRELLQPGDHVRVYGLPARREPFMLALANVLLPDGREVQFLTGAPAYFTSSEAVVRGTDRVIDARRENRGIFRVWSVPEPNPAGAAALGNLPFTPGAVAARASFDLLDNFATRCEPEGLPRIMFNPHPFEFVDRGDAILLRSELYDIERTIHMNRTDVPAAEPHSRLGYSLGQWVDDALVVTTTHIDWPFFDNAGTPQSEAVEIVERYRLSEDQARLSFSVTVTDPTTFTAPAVIESYWLALGHTIDRYDCGLAR